MPKDEAQPAKRIAQLRDEIKEHDRRYYEEAAPTISDREYDRLYKELVDLEAKFPDLITPNSPTQITFLISCPPAGFGEIKTPSRGELTPKTKNGTLIWSAPSKIEFGAGSGELELAGVPEGKVNGSLKVMGYEPGEII